MRTIEQVVDECLHTLEFVHSTAVCGKGRKTSYRISDRYVIRAHGDHSDIHDVFRIDTFESSPPRVFIGSYAHEVESDAMYTVYKLEEI